jgi:peptidyl-prolyl cis-trans isomerase SurA
MRRILPTCLLVALVAIPVTLNADTIVEEIITRVNNQIITRTEYQRSKDELKQEAQQQDPANADKVVAEREKDILRDLIDQQLLLEKGKDLSITGDTEVIKWLDDMRKSMKLDSMEALEKAATAQGISFEDFKLNKRNEIITQQVIGREVGQKLSITKEEEQQFYDQHKAELERPEQVKLSEILISTEKKGAAANAPEDPEVVAKSQAKAADVLAQIKKGTAFEDLAKKNSDGPTAAQGGDLSYFKRGDMSKQLEDQTFAMKKGEVTDVVRTKQGFVILKVTDHVTAGIPPMSEITGKLQDALYMQKLQPALREYLKKLREEAFIEYKPGYIDSGRSANQTQPVETTTKDATAKELKKKKKKLGVL